LQEFGYKNYTYTIWHLQCNPKVTNNITSSSIITMQIKLSSHELCCFTDSSLRHNMVGSVMQKWIATKTTPTSLSHTWQLTIYCHTANSSLLSTNVHHTNFWTTQSARSIYTCELVNCVLICALEIHLLTDLFKAQPDFSGI